MNTTTEERAVADNAESIDHRLAVIKIALERIYAAQNELLPKVHPQLKNDFCMTRYERMQALLEEEFENHSLLSTWVVSAGN